MVIKAPEFDIDNTEGIPARVSLYNADGSLYVGEPSNVISNVNSTATPLMANATFTGEWEECWQFANITVLIKTDQSSSNDGLLVQFSSDETNIDCEKSFDIDNEHNESFIFVAHSKYFRIVYTNGDVNQTYFRMQSILHYRSVEPSTSRIDADLLSPLPSIKIIERRVLAAGTVYAATTSITQNTAIKEFSFGGRAAGEGMFGIYDDSILEFVPNGNMESVGEVGNWISTGAGDGLALVPTYSTDQAYAGTGSLKLGPEDRSDGNHYPQVTYTYPSPVSYDTWRYISAYFYNFAPAGGATTRTISIRVADSLGNVRIYSVAGLTNAAPFNANGWINIFGELRIPTSQTGSTFDMNNVVSVSLRMQDANNKDYTAIYWDNVHLHGTIDIKQKIYSGDGSSIRFPFDPVVLVESGEVIYVALRNNAAAAAEFQLTVAGVDTE